jgi:type IV secretion system protein VirB10
MPATEIGDPRLQALFGANDPREAGVRPTIRLPGRGIPPMAFIVAMVVIAAILFAVLNARRTSPAEPSVRARPADSAPTSWDVAPLYIPPVQAPQTNPQPLAPQKPSPQIAAAPVPAPKSLAPQVIYAPQPVPQPAPPLPPAPPRVSSGAPLVIDTGGAASPGGVQRSGSPIVPPGQTMSRVRASAFANRSSTVPQGYLISAVLETGFDSTKPGFARAMVSRDVRGFDGKYILIPRGSRLIGEYRSDIGQSQKRAIITWTRLIRPDGMTIALDSPAADTLGRGGVDASVNTHFFQRLGDALLQSTFEIGRAFAGRAVTGPVVVVSGSTTAAAGQLMPMTATNYVPTLTVAPGKSISVFVAHDLDFSAAGAVR